MVFYYRQLQESIWGRAEANKEMKEKQGSIWTGKIAWDKRIKGLGCFSFRFWRSRWNGNSGFLLVWREIRKTQNYHSTKDYWSFYNNADGEGCSDGLEDKETLWNTARVFNLQRIRKKTSLFSRLWCCSSSRLDRATEMQLAVAQESLPVCWGCLRRCEQHLLLCTAVFGYILTCLVSSISLNSLLQTREIIAFLSPPRMPAPCWRWLLWLLRSLTSKSFLCWQRQWSVLVIHSDFCFPKFCEKAQITVLTEQLFIVKSK